MLFRSDAVGDEAKKVITGILTDGVKGIKQVAIKAYDEAHPDAQAEGNDDKDSK